MANLMPRTVHIAMTTCYLILSYHFKWLRKAKWYTHFPTTFFYDILLANVGKINCNISDNEKTLVFFVQFWFSLKWRNLDFFLLKCTVCWTRSLIVWEECRNSINKPSLYRTTGVCLVILGAFIVTIMPLCVNYKTRVVN